MQDTLVSAGALPRTHAGHSNADGVFGARTAAALASFLDGDTNHDGRTRYVTFFAQLPEATRNELPSPDAIAAVRQGDAEYGRYRQAHPNEHLPEHRPADPQAYLASRLQHASPSALAATMHRMTEARDVFREGSRAAAHGDFDRAHDLFERAFQVFNEPNVLFNMARASIDGHHDDRASAELDRYLALVPNDTEAQQLRARLGGGARAQSQPSMEAARSESSARPGAAMARLQEMATQAGLPMEAQTALLAWMQRTPEADVRATLGRLGSFDSDVANWLGAAVPAVRRELGLSGPNADRIARAIYEFFDNGARADGTRVFDGAEVRRLAAQAYAEFRQQPHEPAAAPSAPSSAPSPSPQASGGPQATELQRRATAAHIPADVQQAVMQQVRNTTDTAGLITMLGNIVRSNNVQMASLGLGISPEQAQQLLAFLRQGDNLQVAERAVRELHPGGG
jgi:hypothetical protein